MRIKYQPCLKCNNDKYSITFKYGIFFLKGVKCKKCKTEYKIKGVLPYMSTQYIDVMFKITLILVMIYYAILKFPFGIAYMLVLWAMLNYIIYPFMLKIGMLMIDNGKDNKNGKKG